MRAFYLHGYTSTGLTSDKRTALEQLELEVIAPVYTYPKMQDILPTIQKEVEDQKPDFLIGSSMGGRLAFYLANMLQLPALLFNPALVHPLIDQYHPVPENYQIMPFYHNQHFTLGQQDEIVPPSGTLLFLKTSYPNQSPHYTLLPNLAHRISSELLKQHTKAFIKQYF